jgi:hypothetical protein
LHPCRQPDAPREIARIVAVALLVIAAAALLVLVGRAQRDGRELAGSRDLRMLFLILHFIPPVVDEAERLGSKLPVYVKDFEEWAEHNEQFRELNDKYDITSTLSDQASKIPSHLGGAASDAKNLTVELLENLLAAITVLVLTFFLLIDGREQARRMIARLPAPTPSAGSGSRVGSTAWSRATSRSTSRWPPWRACSPGGCSSCSASTSPLPLAVLVAFLDLIALVGLTIAGILVAAMAALHGFPTR